MKAARGRATRSVRRGSSTLPAVRASQCDIVAVGKRRDGGTRYWCLKHRADATAKYGKRGSACRAANLEPESGNVFALDLDIYRGPVALWGAVPAIYDTTRLPVDRGMQVYATIARKTRRVV